MGKIVELKDFLCRFLLYTYCIKVVVLLTFRSVFVEMSALQIVLIAEIDCPRTFLSIRIAQLPSAPSI